MYWFPRPPYLRYVAAGLLVLTAIAVDLRPRPTTLHAFAATDLAAGQTVSEADLEWRAIPSGVLPPSGVEGRASHDLVAGEHLGPGTVTTAAVQIPDGWWSFEAPIPTDAVVGQSLQLIVSPSPQAPAAPVVPAVVVRAATPGSTLSAGSPGIVAAPADTVAIAAVAASENRLTVLLGNRK